MDQIEELLTRGVANVIPNKDSLETLLRKSKKLNIYHGVDPTATKLHLGNAFQLRLLQKFVNLGHAVTFLIGDFTALVGDTSDKDSERPILTPEQIQENFRDYKTQASKILDFDKVTIRHNSEWLGSLTPQDFIKLTRHFTLNDFISRELIKKRLAEGKSVSLPEVLYPALQGYDSYILDTDIQIGGTDQTFNMQAGRVLQKQLRSKESFVLSTVFLTGTDGRKMSKSWGNAIWLDDSPEDMFGKAMSIKDDLIIEYFTLATSLPMERIATVKSRLDSGENPMNLKKELALQIVTELHDEKAATSSQLHFEKTIQEGGLPDNLPEATISSDNLINALVEADLSPSKSDARRLIAQGGVEINGQKVIDPESKILNQDVVRVGKTRFAKLIYDQKN